jgi:hypothetical protein
MQNAERRLRSMGRMPFMIAAACLTLLPSLARAERDAALSSYAILVRDILIVRQCGLSNELVEAGFRLQVEALAAAGGLTPETAAAARERGQEAYRLAWRDRGSGPVDPRCRREGASAAAGFRAFIMAD